MLSSKRYDRYINRVILRLSQMIDINKCNFSQIDSYYGKINFQNEFDYLITCYVLKIMSIQGFSFDDYELSNFYPIIKEAMKTGVFEWLRFNHEDDYLTDYTRYFPETNFDIEFIIHFITPKIQLELLLQNGQEKIGEYIANQYQDEVDSLKEQVEILTAKTSDVILRKEHQKESCYVMTSSTNTYKVEQMSSEINHLTRQLKKQERLYDSLYNKYESLQKRVGDSSAEIDNILPNISSAKYIPTNIGIAFDNEDHPITMNRIIEGIPGAFPITSKNMDRFDADYVVFIVKYCSHKFFDRVRQSTTAPIYVYEGTNVNALWNILQREWSTVFSEESLG